MRPRTGMFRKESKQGKVYYGGNFTAGDLRKHLEGFADADKVFVDLWKNEDRKTENHPPYSLTLSEPPAGASKPSAPPPPVSDDDIPF